MIPRILVIAPHPDDEVLGVGGTIARLAAEGTEVTVAIVTRGMPPVFEEKFIEQGRAEARRAHEILGVKRTLFLDFPATELERASHREMNSRLAGLLRDYRPTFLFVPFNGDVHLDHQRVFQSAIVAARPNSDFAPQSLYLYETLSETNWNAPYVTPAFTPNVYVDVTDHMEKKVAAMQAFTTQLKPFPHERSVESLRALAVLRGTTVGRPAAEAFVLVRSVI